MPQERIFLDTCIVCNLRWIFSDEGFEDGFFEHYSEKFMATGQELRRDCMALRFLMDKDDQFLLEFLISDNVLTELQRTKTAGRRAELMSIADSIITYSQEHHGEYLEESDLPTLTTEDEMVKLGHALSFLPDEDDKRLIIDSIQARCHIFMTVDRKTIWKHRYRLSQLGINVKRPLEYLQGFMFPLSTANLGFLGPDDIINLIERAL